MKNIFNTILITIIAFNVSFAQLEVDTTKQKPRIIEAVEVETESTEEIYKVVEKMPLFPGCDTGTNLEKKACADKKMLNFIANNVSYPEIARNNGIEGTVVVSFIIDKSGEIRDAKVVRDIGGGCGKESLRVVNKMPKWVPGVQRGKPVSVQFNLPVKFKLTKPDGKKKRKRWFSN